MSDELQRVLRAVVPDDGKAHEIAGRLLHVGAGRDLDGLEVYVQTNPLLVERYVVVGTGDVVAPGWQHVGTAVGASLLDDRHLFRLPTRERS